MVQVSVCGYFTRSNLTPADGYITFTPRTQHVIVSGGPIEVGQLTATLDATGHFTISLQATDDPGINPTGWTYEVEEKLSDGIHRNYDISVPMATIGCLDLGTVAPVPSSEGTVQLTPGPPGPTGPCFGTYTPGTQPSAFYASVTLTAGAWTQLWGANDARSFAAVLGGTGVPGEIVYISASNTALITDPNVARSDAVRGPLYFETRGTNALYARLNVGHAPLLVRTTTSLQVTKAPPPATIGVKDYKIVADCGGGAVTYTSVSGAGPVYAPVLDKDPARTRVTLLGNAAPVMFGFNWQDASVLALIVATAFASSGVFFPGPLPIEGIDAISLLDIGGAGEQTAAYWVRDRMVAL